jgi:hypothetical protein
MPHFKNLLRSLFYKLLDHHSRQAGVYLLPPDIPVLEADKIALYAEEHEVAPAIFWAAAKDTYNASQTFTSSEIQALLDNWSDR